jgi:alpha-galactosidase
MIVIFKLTSLWYKNAAIYLIGLVFQWKMLKIISFFLFFPFLVRTMTTTIPFETLLLETPSTVNLKYTIDNIQSRYSLPLKTSTTIGQLAIDKKVHLLDPDNFEVTYDWKNTGETSLTLQQLEIEFSMNLEQQVMFAEGFQCWSTSKEMDKYNKLSAIPSVVSWITQFNLQG